MDKLGDFSTLGDMVQRLEDIKKQQQEIGKKFNDNAKDNLGKKPEELSKDARDKNDQLAKEQESVQQKTQKMLSDMDKKADDMKKSDAGKSQAMKDAAKAGSQVPQQQQQNAQIGRSLTTRTFTKEAPMLAAPPGPGMTPAMGPGAPQNIASDGMGY